MFPTVSFHPYLLISRLLYSIGLHQTPAALLPAAAAGCGSLLIIQNVQQDGARQLGQQLHNEIMSVF